MRVIIVFLALIVALCWAAFELRPRDKSIANALFAVAAVLGVIFLIALIDSQR